MSRPQKHADAAVGAPQATRNSNASFARHERPAQHSPPPLVQVWPPCAQTGGSVQTPATQVSVGALQQSAVSVHAWPVLAHVGPVLPWHVPLVAPGGISQVSPEQQSAVTVQLPLAAWHGARQTSLQIVEQQSAPEVHEVPFGRHDVHVPFRQSPTQHAAPPTVQAAPGSTQEGGGVASAQTQPISPTYLHDDGCVGSPGQHGSGTGAEPWGGAAAVEQMAPFGRHWLGGWTQRRMPSAPGVHGEPPQHWSRNWQMAPGWMQQFGSLPSQPVGQVVVTFPPKQRRIPFESGLHTTEPLPPPSWQQFCDAL